MEKICKGIVVDKILRDAEPTQNRKQSIAIALSVSSKECTKKPLEVIRRSTKNQIVQFCPKAVLQEALLTKFRTKADIARLLTKEDIISALTKK